MLVNEELERIIIYKCSECGLSNTKLKAEEKLSSDTQVVERDVGRSGGRVIGS